MNRDEWKALHRRARVDAKSLATVERRNGRGMVRLRLDHGTTWFNVDCAHDDGKASLTVQPAIIRDRSPNARIADALAWARYFRVRRLPGSTGRDRDHMAASACVAEAREIRLGASLFALLP